VVGFKQLAVADEAREEVDDLLHLYIEHERHLHLLLLDERDEHEEHDHETHEQMVIHEQLVNQ